MVAYENKLFNVNNDRVLLGKKDKLNETQN